MSSVIGNGASTEYHIIDGQQRLTTVSLLLLAIRNLIRQKKITAQEDRLDDQINDRFLVSPWAKEGDKIRNYILMGQPLKDQNKLYDTYWTTIERCTGNDVSGFVRD